MLLLEFLRREKGISQAELGRRCKIDKTYMSKAERYGFAFPGHLSKIARELDWEDDPAMLLDDVEVVKPHVNV